MQTQIVHLWADVRVISFMALFVRHKRIYAYSLNLQQIALQECVNL